MSKSRFVFDKLAKLIEQGFINYKDFSNELMNILNSKRDEIIFKMKIAEKEEINVIGKRLEKIEKRLKILENKNLKKKIKKVKKS
tara:strand:+ start:1024 stop:1278 length:255 start_codon:yes stop_codon:yes gene_type:complete